MLITMKKTQASLVDLHYDILKEILIRVVRSPNGAKDFAKVITVCKTFQKFVDDEDLLRAVAFEDLSIDGRWELFRQRRGLICRCVQAGGEEQAKFILAKIILVSVSQLLKVTNDSEASDFLQNFMPDETLPTFIGYHFDFVKIFLARVNLREFMCMNPYMNDYMIYFIENTQFTHRTICQTYKKFAAVVLANYHYFLLEETKLHLRAIDILKQAIMAHLVALDYLLLLGMNKELDEICDDGWTPVSAGRFAMTNMMMERLDKEMTHLRALTATMERLLEKQDVLSLPSSVSDVARIESEIEQIKAKVSMLLASKEKHRLMLEKLLGQCRTLGKVLNQ